MTNKEDGVEVGNLFTATKATWLSMATTITRPILAGNGLLAQPVKRAATIIKTLWMRCARRIKTLERPRRNGTYGGFVGAFGQYLVSTGAHAQV